MAVLNIANLFNETYLSRSPKELIFTRDKHIVTHGVDFLADYNLHTRGLIPDYDLDNNKGVFGHNGWTEITAEMLPILTDLSGTTDNTTIPTSNAVKSYLSTLINAAQRMLFKGVVGISNGTVYHKPVGSTTTIEGMPTTASVGDTYLVGESGTLVGETVLAGDMIICKKSYTTQTSETSTNLHWFVIQRNLDLKTTTFTIGNLTASVFSDTTKSVTIYNPINAGTSGQILVSKGNTTPEWLSLGLTINANGTISHTIGSTGTATLSALSSGVGLYFSDSATSYNGGVARTINLAKATTTTLGGIKIDDGKANHGNPQDATPTISIDNNGMIYLTLQNIANALGYLPSDPSGLVTYSAGQGINLDNQIISLLKATNTSLGGIIASNVLTDTAVSLTSSDGSTANRYYGVLIDKDGKAFVNVPWTDSNNTWREITIGGNSIGNQTLNFITVANGSIGIVANGNDLNTNNTDIFDIGFDIFWYNLDKVNPDGTTGGYETN